MANGLSHLPARIFKCTIRTNKAFKTVFTRDLFAVKTDPGALAHVYRTRHCCHLLALVSIDNIVMSSEREYLASLENGSAFVHFLVDMHVKVQTLTDSKIVLSSPKHGLSWQH